MNKKGELPKGYFTVGNKLMCVCDGCGKIIRVDKPIFGSLHLCLTPEEAKRQLENIQ